VSRTNEMTETIVSNSSGKTALQYQVLLYTVDSRRQNMKRNKQILNLNSASIKDIIFATKAANNDKTTTRQRQKTTIELSLFTMRSFSIVKMQTTLTCRVVTLVLRSPHRLTTLCVRVHEENL